MAENERPRGQASIGRDVWYHPQRSFGHRRDELLKRFEATIPLNRRVRVTWMGIRVKEGIRTAVGIAHKLNHEIIFIRTPYEIIWIPKTHLINIEGVNMPLPPEKPEFDREKFMAAENQDLPYAARAKAFDDPVYERFQTAILFEERVEVDMIEMQATPDSGAIVYLNTIQMFCGHARQLDDKFVFIGPRPTIGSQSDRITVIPRARISDIRFLGPQTEELAF